MLGGGVLLAACWGCSSTSTTTAANASSSPTNGGSSTGGAMSGGDTAVGGSTARGGTSSNAGAGATGGAMSAGGATPTGGSNSTTGTPSTGGNTAVGGSRMTGGAPASGGTPTSGGAIATGGAKATGGLLSVGGTVSTGGSKATGGTNAKGGTGTGAANATGGITGTGGGTSTSSSTAGADTTIVPDASWTCGMADGMPPPTKGTLVFRATLQLGDTQDVGTTQYGHRRVLDVKGGTITGDRFSGTVLTGGFDFELTLSNGVIEVESINMLKASDNTIIYLRTCGVAPAGASEVRMVPDFEVDKSKSLAWLNTGKFVGTRVVNATAGTIQFDVYDVASVAVGDPRVQISKPAGVPNQPWDCSTTTGTKGASVFTENVTLGSTLSVGTSDHGTRNVIPITGGTISGKLTGKIVSGGGDYQLTPSGGSTRLDAKYVLAPNDGEFVVVRNCGPMGALIPQFETRADGPYAFLNANTFVSSDPGSGSGGVSITFYERK